MSLERINRAPKAAGANGRTRRLGPIAAPTLVPSAKVLGIPDAEFTPRVRAAMLKMVAEAEGLRQALTDSRARIEEIERAADQDQLLPLLNRRAFVRELTRNIGFTARYGTPASLVYFDLDGFKSINDTYGHAAGDAVLAHFAATLRSHVRDSDVVGRLGGDEFGIILSHADKAQAHKKAAVLMDRLTQNPAQWEGRMLPVGFSYGAFELEAAESADAAIARADEAMYRQKRGGR
ncbi:MAG: GGDEF domain-containing protein [Rhizomicrobium sp.]|jgi:diguanylate cyclase (GGDEF)-like protein